MGARRCLFYVLVVADGRLLWGWVLWWALAAAYSLYESNVLALRSCGSLFGSFVLLLSNDVGALLLRLCLAAVAAR